MSTAPQPPLRRSKSKSRLVSLFSRSKTAVNIDDEPPSPAEAIPPLPNGNRVDSIVPEPQKQESRPVTSKSLKEFSSGDRYSRILLKPNPKASPPRPKTMTSTVEPKLAEPKSQKSLLKPNWEPPPLFQAYPQAIRQASLPVSTVPAETIIKTRKPKKITNLSPGASPKKKHKRQVSINSAGWSEKIFILVTSGYLLQYSSEGHYDRLPEKTLRLGKSSVAFVSDAIPGRHFVLQVSQGVHGEECTDSSSIFSKFSFRSAVRACTSGMLLVFENAEDMDAWMVAVRREIALLGGRQPAPEVGISSKQKSAEDDRTQSLRKTISQRFNVKKDSFMFPPPDTDRPIATTERELGHRHLVSDETSVSTQPRSSQRASFDSPSLATTISTSDNVKLSHTSRSSGSSYATATTELPNGFTMEKGFTLPEKGNSKLSSLANRRKSMAAFTMTPAEAPPMMMRPKSSYIQALVRPGSSASPTVPNFSFPSAHHTPSPAVTTTTVIPPQPSKKPPPVPTISRTSSDRTETISAQDLTSTSFLDDSNSDLDLDVDMEDIMDEADNSSDSSPERGWNRKSTMPFVPPKRLSSLAPMTDNLISFSSENTAALPFGAARRASTHISMMSSTITSSPAAGAAEPQIAKAVRLQYRKSMPALAVLNRTPSPMSSLPPAGPPPACPLPKTPLEMSENPPPLPNSATSSVSKDTAGSASPADYFLSPSLTTSTSETSDHERNSPISPLSPVPGTPLSVGVGERRMLSRHSVQTVRIKSRKSSAVPEDAEADAAAAFANITAEHEKQANHNHLLPHEHQHQHLLSMPMPLVNPVAMPTKPDAIGLGVSVS